MVVNRDEAARVNDKIFLQDVGVIGPSYRPLPVRERVGGLNVQAGQEEVVDHREQTEDAAARVGEGMEPIACREREDSGATNRGDGYAGVELDAVYRGDESPLVGTVVVTVAPPCP